MGYAMPPHAGYHCPICNEDFPTFTDFDSESHKCCQMMAALPHVAERVITARIHERERERRAAFRYKALF